MPPHHPGRTRTAAPDLATEFGRVLPLDSSLWAHPRTGELPAELLEDLTAATAEELLARLDYTRTRVRAFIQDPPMVATLHSAKEAAQSLQDGDTIMVDDAAHLSPTLRQSADVLCERLGIQSESCAVKLSLSPNGGGVFPHFDQYDSLQIQLQGTKTWQVSATPAVANPVDAYASGVSPSPSLSGYAEAEQLRPPALDEVVLVPGRFLTVPRGTWHQTAAGAFSASAIIRFAPPPWVNLLQPENHEAARTQARWRAPAYGAWGAGAALQAAADEAHRLLAASSGRAGHVHPAVPEPLQRLLNESLTS
ncbi:JmjC domain-containing protein [Streptomyces nojiriensis]|uniref:JmjC domain-containing protein n=1 Tax=Streptomyces nojiriensis TaxID=66374 RepID=UPI0035DF264C